MVCCPIRHNGGFVGCLLGGGRCHQTCTRNHFDPRRGGHSVKLLTVACNFSRRKLLTMDKYRPSEKPFLCSVSLAYRSLDQVGNGNNDDDSLLHGRDTHIRSDEVTSLWSARFFLWRTKPNGWDDVLLWTHSYSSNHARFADGQQAGRSVRISVLFVLHDPAPLRVLWH